MTNRDRLMREIAAVHAFYDREVTDATMRVWLDVMEDEDAHAFAAACKAHMRDPDVGAHCPKPADVIRQLHGNVDEAATLAWADVLAAARNGHDLPHDPVVRSALESLGGLSMVQRADESQNGFLQRRFVDAFRAFRHRHERASLASGATLLAIGNHKGAR